MRVVFFLLSLFAIWLFAFLGAWRLYAQGRLRNDYHRDLLALGALALATVGFFWRLLFTSAWMPADGGDLLSFLFPLYRFAAQSLKGGEVPLWNPYLYGGAPFAADIQTGLFYPINLLLFFLVPKITFRALELISVLHFFLAGAFMYLCLRFIRKEGRIGRLASLAGAIAFMFSDLFIIHFGNLNMIAAASWLPLVFLFYHRALTERRVNYAVLAGLFLGVAILAGHIQPIFHILFLLGLYLLYRLYLACREDRRAIPLLLGLTALTVVIALGATAFLLLPGYEMMQLSVRAQISYEEAARFSLSPAQLIGLLNPGFFGRGPRLSWGLWDRVEVGYIGVLPLVLASLALLFRRDGLTRFLLVLAIISLLLALGDSAILHGWLYGLVPGFKQLRAPARFILLLDFALAFLAALGLDAILRPLRHGKHALFKGVLRLSFPAFLAITLVTLPLAYGVLIYSQDKDPVILQRIANATRGQVLFLLFLGGSLFLLYIRGHRWVRPQMVGFLAIGLIFVDLAATGAYIDIGTSDPTRGFQHSAAVEFLKGDEAFYRIEVPRDAWGVWQPDLALIQRLFDIGGIYTPLELADFERYRQAIGSRSSPLYSFLNAKYLITQKGASPGEGYLLAFDGDPRVDIYRTTAFPRAFIVYRSQVVVDHESAWAAIQAPGFDPAKALVVEGGKALEGDASEGRAVITSYSLNEIGLEVEAAKEGYLVLSEVYYPGWRAYVDGTEEPLLRANYAFRAVYLEPGSHEVRLAFAPTSWKVGLLIGAGTWLVLLFWGAWQVRRRLRER